MKRGTILLCCLVFMSALISASCAPTTTLTAVWKDPRLQGPVKRVVVMGIAQNQTNRNFFEDEFVMQLKARGNDAVAGYTLIPFDQVRDKEFVASKLKSSGADTVLVTRLVDKKTIETYVPGVYYPPYYAGWGGYYGYSYSPGYVVEDQYVFVETNVYEVKTDQLVWSARSETWVTQSDQQLLKSFIQVMVTKLAADGVIR